MSADRIICLDGMSGSGKSTSAKILVKTLNERDNIARLIIEKEHEPFKTVIDSWYASGRPRFNRDWVFRIADARSETYARHFKNAHEILVFDRYFYTSAVYQRESDLSVDEIVAINLNAGSPRPTNAFILECDPELALKRVKERDYAFKYFEPELEQFTKNKSVFEELAKSQRITRIDTTNHSVDQVIESIKQESLLSGNV